MTLDRFRSAALLVALLACGLRAAACLGQQHQRFESAEPSWQIDDSDAIYHLEAHDRQQSGARGGSWCEHIRLGAGNGTFVHLRHNVPEASVIRELAPSLWIRSDRAGLQLFARVVLPRIIDPHTGQPLAALVAGDTYVTPGPWQQLRIDRLPERLERRIRGLRAEIGPQVDGREAYVDALVLNAYGGPGTTNVWIDDLDLGGFVPRRPPIERTGAVVPAAHHQRTASGGMAQVELSGSRLQVDGRPIFPRVIEYQGEAFARLKQLGFNAVKLSELATAEQLEEAARLDMWIVCPPPRPEGLGQPDAPRSSLTTISSEFDRVLAWDLGGRLTRDDLPDMRRWADQVRLADHRLKRPLFCNADVRLRTYSRHVDLLGMYRLPLGGSLDVADYGHWIAERSRLARPGTPLWALIQSEPAPAVIAQTAALSAGVAPRPQVTSEQMRLLAHTALSAGVRGLIFASDTSLAAGDPAAQLRATALELLNLELDLVEPWVASGNFLATLSSSDPHIRGAVLQTERTRLLLPIWSEAGDQAVPSQAAGNNVSFVVPGIPESNDAYEITPAGMRPLRHKRVAGGIRITADEFDVTGMVLLTQDPLAIEGLKRRLETIARRAAELQRALAASRIAQAAEIDRRLSSLGVNVPPAGDWLARANGYLGRADAAWTGGEAHAAYLEARRALRAVRLLERAHWQAAMDRLPSAVTSPLATSFVTLPDHWRLVAQLNSSQPGPNRVPFGDFENLNRMVEGGWRHLQDPNVPLRSEADISAVEPFSGRFSLRLKTAPTDEADELRSVGGAAMWVDSPPLRVEAGEILRIHGWVRVPEEITGSVDGLMIVDSLGGEVLAERIASAPAWREFTLYRAAAHAGWAKITFAMTGVGEAWLDEVSVQRVLPAGGPSLDAAQAAGLRPMAAGPPVR